MTQRSNDTQTFDEQKTRLLSIAYKMLGTLMEAEDVVQDAFERWVTLDKVSINNHEAYLTTMVTRLCLDHLKSARQQRELYIGPWLPEPIVETEDTPGPDWHHELADRLSYGLLALLESLSASERAVYILREAFDLSYQEIAEILALKTDHARQLNARAKKKIRLPELERKASSQHDALFRAFVVACGVGDLQQLKNLLSDEVVAYSDGGGKVIAALRPLQGLERVMRFLNRLMAQRNKVANIKWCQVNGQAGVMLTDVDGNLSVLTVEHSGDKIESIYVMRNPDKLQHAIKSTA